MKIAPDILILAGFPEPMDINTRNTGQMIVSEKRNFFFARKKKANIRAVAKMKFLLFSTISYRYDLHHQGSW